LATGGGQRALDKWIFLEYKKYVIVCETIEGGTCDPVHEADLMILYTAMVTSVGTDYGTSLVISITQLNCREKRRENQIQ